MSCQNIFTLYPFSKPKPLFYMEKGNKTDQFIIKGITSNTETAAIFYSWFAYQYKCILDNY